MVKGPRNRLPETVARFGRAHILLIKTVQKHNIERYISALICYRVFFNIKLKLAGFVFNNKPEQYIGLRH
jgi:hypothetical protein